MHRWYNFAGQCYSLGLNIYQPRSVSVTGGPVPTSDPSPTFRRPNIWYVLLSVAFATLTVIWGDVVLLSHCYWQWCFSCSTAQTPIKACLQLTTMISSGDFERAIPVAMNIQLADRLRLFDGMLQFQNDKLMQNVAVHLDLARRRGRRHRRQCWVRNWILERPLFGQYQFLIDQLLIFYLYGYRNFVTFSPDLFREWEQRFRRR